MEKVAGRLSSPLGNTILLWVFVGDGKNPLGPDSLGLLDRTDNKTTSLFIGTLKTFTKYNF